VSPGLASIRGDVDLEARARALTARGRAVIGIAGPPAAGKSTLAARIAATLGPEAVVVPMDGFHLHDDELARLGLSDRKGAPETFDTAGYAALLRRIRTETETTVYAPAFDRSREESIAGAIAVRPSHRLVVTEGNYLLLDTGAWPRVRSRLDEVWFCELDEQERLRRLIARHEEFGKGHEEAVSWVLRSDQRNAELVAATRDRADLVIPVGGLALKN
jgi:pantothenate kinase